MKINRFHLSHSSFEAPRPPRTAQPDSVEADSALSQTRKREETGGMGMVRQYLDRLKEFPDVRPDLIEAARTRYADGEYITRQAAVETAQAVIRGS
jgi:hypothetical protein